LATLSSTTARRAATVESSAVNWSLKSATDSATNCRQYALMLSTSSSAWATNDCNTLSVTLLTNGGRDVIVGRFKYVIVGAFRRFPGYENRRWSWLLGGAEPGRRL